MNDPNVDDRTNESEEDADIQRPPMDLLRMAREITGRAIMQQDLMRAWDSCNGTANTDNRAAACLEKLLDLPDHKVHANDKVMVARHESTTRDFAGPAGPSTLAKKRNINEISDSSDSSEEVQLISPSKKVCAIKDSASVVKWRKSHATGEIRKEQEHILVPDLSSQPKPQSESSSPSSSPNLTPQDAMPLTSAAELSRPETSSLVQVLAMVPDVAIEHAMNLVERWKALPNCVEHVMDALLEGPYPKAPTLSAGSSGINKGKGRAKDAEDEPPGHIDYDNVAKRALPSESYTEAAFDYLCLDFPLVPKPYVRKVLIANLHFFAPSHVQLALESSKEDAPFKKLVMPRKEKGKGIATKSGELDAEREWSLARQARKQAIADEQLAAEEREKEEEAAGHVFECGCCFGEYVFSRMVQCPEAHLFCMDCARKNAESVMGNRRTDLQCMHEDGCTALFPVSECIRFLKLPQLELLDKLRSEQAIDLAELAGLAKCPHCPWACIIDNPEERLFRCGNENCLKVTCLGCKKSDHLPKTCEEYAADLKTNNVHLVEEAMTNALIKKCPKSSCQSSILKEYGCNKMTCSTCGTLFCFVCAEAINGYHHFKNQFLQAEPGKAPMRNSTSTCALWDDTRSRQQAEVEAARDSAINKLKAIKDALVTDEELEKLKVDIPTPQGHPVEGIMNGPFLMRQPFVFPPAVGHAGGAPAAAGRFAYPFPARPPLPKQQKAGKQPRQQRRRD